jgi:HSP20 family protein
MLYRAMVTAPVFGLRREIDRLFENTFGRGPVGQVGQSEWSPAVDIRETEQELAFEVELPGIAQEDVEVTAADGILTIRGERTEERREGEEGRYYMIERSYGSFTRSFQLPQGVDEERIQADFERGLLRVRIPNAALLQPKKIQIKVGADASSPTPYAIGRGASGRDAPKKAAAAHQPK